MSASKPTTWEYQLTLINLGLKDDYDATSHLNNLGSIGWEAVAVVPGTGPHSQG